MARDLREYKVFVGSPGGVEAERRTFSKTLKHYSTVHSQPRGVIFHPVGWEDTLGGRGRPQALINQDLEPCDYAVFILHDRWGTPSGLEFKSGFEEEWTVAERLYLENKMRNIVLFYKGVDPNRLVDPGPQLRLVLEFIDKVRHERKYLFKQYSDVEHFSQLLEAHLAGWLLDHERTDNSPSRESLAQEVSHINDTNRSSSDAPRDYVYWLAEANKAVEEGAIPDYASALVFFRGATAAARTGTEWAAAQIGSGAASLHLGRIAEALSAFEAVTNKLAHGIELDERQWWGLAMYHRGVALGTLGRHVEEIKQYDEILRSFSNETEPQILNQVARTLFNKGIRLETTGHFENALETFDAILNKFSSSEDVEISEIVIKTLVTKADAIKAAARYDDAIAIYQIVLNKFANPLSIIPNSLREVVGNALFGKAACLEQSGQTIEAIQTIDELVNRFAIESNLSLRRLIARSLVNQGVAFANLGDSSNALGAYDKVLSMFGNAADPVLREELAKAFYNKACRLNTIGDVEGEIRALTELAFTFDGAPERPVREIVALGLFNKGVQLQVDGQDEAAFTTYKELCTRFDLAIETTIQLQVAKATINKGTILAALERFNESSKEYEDIINRFASSKELLIREQVALALSNRGKQFYKLNDIDRGNAALYHLIDRFGAATESILVDKVVEARRLLNHFLKSKHSKT